MVWNLEYELLSGTCRNKFRALGDVNQYIFSYYNFCTGKFVPRHPNFGKSYRAGQQDQQMFADISKGVHKVICINDNPSVQDFETLRRQIIKLYENKLPEKSSYEK